MTSLFAPQFNYAALYPQSRLPVSQPAQVNFRLPDDEDEAPEDEPASKPVSEPTQTPGSATQETPRDESIPGVNKATQPLAVTPARTPGYAYAARNAAMPDGIDWSAGTGRQTGTGSYDRAPSPSGYGMNPGTSSNLNMSQFFDLPASSSVSPKVSETPASKPQSSGGFWSDLGHELVTPGTSWGSLGGTLAHGVSDVDGAMNNRFVKGMMNFGGIPGSVPQANPAIEGQVVPRSATPAGELNQAAPKVIEGDVVGPEALNVPGTYDSVGAGVVRPGLPRGWGGEAEDIFNANDLNSIGRNLNSAQFGEQTMNAAKSTPWYDALGSDAASLGEDVLSGIIG
jgi:hypothetical protein